LSGDDDRIGYLAGDSGDSLDAGDAFDAGERASLDRLRQILSDPALWAEPSADLEGRVMSAITAEPVGSAQAPQPQQAASHPRSRRRRVMAAVAAVAAVALIAGITLSLASTSSHGLRLHSALVATSLAPGAAGTATLTQTSAGWKIELRADGLPRLDNGRFYAAWLKNPAGVAVPVGTFNQGPRVTLWAGVSPQHFPTLTITAETANGNPSSRRPVLIGTVGR
jgi:hypothetical protein